MPASPVVISSMLFAVSVWPRNRLLICRRLQARELGLAGDLELPAAGRDRHVVLAEQRLDLAVEVERHVLQGAEQTRAACR